MLYNKKLNSSFSNEDVATSHIDIEQTVSEIHTQKRIIIHDIITIVAATSTYTATHNNNDDSSQPEDDISPTKREMMKIFKTTPDNVSRNLGLGLLGEKPETTEKKVIPHLKQLAYGEVLTTEDVLNRIKVA